MYFNQRYKYGFFCICGQLRWFNILIRLQAQLIIPGGFDFLPTGMLYTRVNNSESKYWN